MLSSFQTFYVRIEWSKYNLLPSNLYYFLCHWTVWYQYVPNE